MACCAAGSAAGGSGERAGKQRQPGPQGLCRALHLAPQTVTSAAAVAPSPAQLFIFVLCQSSVRMVIGKVLNLGMGREFTVSPALAWCRSASSVLAGCFPAAA